ncbi:MAG: twin-arginine translocation signal domain-containing protein [Acidobacteria bacterium]|nr:twin-arginine translocation signal domain-containing protein [Acidobacteriota bacterium]
MAKKQQPESQGTQSKPPQGTRREFLKGVTTAAVAGLPLGSSASSGLLPTVPFGPHRITRLIVGSNPLRGFAHFNAQYGRHMLEYFTDERSVKFLLDCERAGINTYQSSYYPPRLQRHLEGVRQAGSKLQWVCLAAPWAVMEAKEWTPELILEGTMKCIEAVAKLKPIGIALHGSATDRLWRLGKMEPVTTIANKIHDLGLLAGASIHNPQALGQLEQTNCPVDFYMTSLYNMTREPEDFQKEFGVVPVGETYLASDPERMCKVIRQSRKPCLAYKVLAAGRRCDSPHEVRQAFEFAFKNIKPNDAIIVGMYPRFSDQIGENTRLAREILL